MSDPVSRRTIDLDNTERCPLDLSCVSCRGVADLAVCTLESPIGVFCITLCAFCAQENDLPNFSPVSAVHASLEHCRHLGIDADQMAATLESDR